MRKRLFLYTVLILSTGLLCFFSVSLYITHRNNLQYAQDSVVELAQIYAELYTPEMNLDSFVTAGSETRITVVSSDGWVLADSTRLDLDSLENHLSRPEIQAAANGAPATFVRYSESLGFNLIYYALKVKSADGFVFIRAALPVAGIDEYLVQSLPLLIGILLLIAALCFVFARSMINRITSPFGSVEQRLRLLAGGEYTPGTITGSYEEIELISRNIDEVAQILQKSLTTLQDEKNKAEYILNNIGDGLFVLDADKTIVLINAAALAIFGVRPDIKGKDINYLSYDKALIEAVGECLKHEKNALFELSRNGRVFFVAVKRLPDTGLIMVVFSDVTENRDSAKQREEFFANASHELKTPLTTIKGFSDLASLNNRDESINKYLGAITRETERMLALISDMLELSELENTQAINPAPISLAAIVNEVREALESAIEEKSIVFEIAGDAVVMAEAGHLYELVKNLVENAVRYNNPQGKVTVNIGQSNKGASLVVADDGIGISPEEQTRIFERFYRVEKSRSQRSGGTGLGLSIVKHICALYDWKLSLASKLGLGTEITVGFPA